ncbi:hypothetical protein MAR_016395 [Mya arenaria]|uniref:BTB domain-containing protein n=1 Tax=Mya arenaria TaxID=6604 RepID=A0ABY7FT84_MYAAR|nr:uncharacterized protein LOC128210332 [Mya arenaria]WAR22421.1 hypothetical protein MAR_016395 [Mya arenaria]
MPNKKDDRDQKRNKEEKEKVKEDGDEEVVIIVDGKPFHFSSELLSRHSSVFKQQLKDHKRQQRRFERLEDDMQYLDVADCMDFEDVSEIGIVIEDFKYSEVKPALDILLCQGKASDLSQKKIRKILPFLYKYEITKLKDLCEQKLQSLLSSSDNADHKSALDHLYLAEKYSLKRLKSVCIDLCATDTSTANRHNVTKDKHVVEKTKIEILNLMFEKMEKRYEYKLQRIQSDMNKRCRQIEKNREKFMEQTEQWKKDMSDKVQEALNEGDQIHADQNEALKKPAKEWDRIYAEISKSIQNAENKGEHLQEDLFEKIQQAVKEGKKMHAEITKVRQCKINEALEESLRENYDLYDQLDQQSVELDERNKRLTESEIEIEKANLLTDKANAKLHKYMQKDHELNTWMKWAKPVKEYGEGCTCFRHVQYRKCLAVN